MSDVSRTSSRITGNAPLDRSQGGQGDGFVLGAGNKQGASAAQPIALEGLGPKLSELRRAGNLTQIDVAHRMGTTQPSLARLEKGEAKPNLRTLSRYASAIGQKADIVFSAAGKDKQATQTLQINDFEGIPKALGDLRRQSGITQADVASRMQTTQPVIARLEGGGVPNLRTLERYSEAIGVKIGIAFSKA